MEGGERCVRERAPSPSHEPDAKVQTILKALEAGIEQIVDSDHFRAYLETMARFHRYSFNNVLLIKMQRPDATRVAGFRAWQEQFGRHVRKGERGIKIITPVMQAIVDEDPDTGEQRRRQIRVGWSTGAVFDVSQTEGKPLPTLATPQLLQGESDASHAIFGYLAGYSVDQGAHVARQAQDYIGRGNGFYSPHTREIAIAAGLKADAAAKTHAHETAHMVADHTGFEDSRDVETVAESAAFVVTHHFGLDTRAYSFDYVAGWAQDAGVFRRNLVAIQQTSHAMITGLEAYLAHPPRTHMVVYGGQDHPA